MRFTDPAFEIKRALEREAERRFDPGRLAAALESQRATRKDLAGPGPLGRLPVPAQWIAVAAAIVAAVTGVRSLYLDLVEPEPAPAARAATRPEEPRSNLSLAIPEESLAAPLAAESERRLRSSDGERGVPLDEARREQPAAGEARSSSPDPAPSKAPEARPDANLPGAIGWAPDSRGAAEPPAQPLADQQARPAQSPAPAVAFVGVPTPPAVSGVEVVADVLARQGLVAKLREIPEIAATLITIRGGRGSQREQAAQPELPGAASGRVAAPSGATNPRSPTEPTSSYYARLLVGAAPDPLLEPDSWVFGKELRVVPLREMEVWGRDDQQAILQDLFELKTLIPTTGLSLVPEADRSEVDADLRVGAGGAVYAISVHAMPGERRGVHRIQVKWSRAIPPRGRWVAEGVEATLLVEEGRVVVLAVPDSLLGGRSFPRPRSDEDTVFLVLSPRSDDPAHELVSWRIDEEPREPAILIDSPPPDYPDAAREAGTAGRVRVRLVVRDDGTVDAVQVIDVPDGRGASLLAGAVAAAVREWRYLPARNHEGPVHSWVEETVIFAAAEP